MNQYIIIHGADQSDKEDFDSFKRGFLLEDPDARSVHDRTWIVHSEAASARRVLENVVRHIREVRQESDPHRKLYADFYAARIDENDRGGQFVTFP